MKEYKGWSHVQETTGYSFLDLIVSIVVWYWIILLVLKLLKHIL